MGVKRRANRKEIKYLVMTVKESYSYVHLCRYVYFLYFSNLLSILDWIGVCLLIFVQNTIDTLREYLLNQFCWLIES